MSAPKILVQIVLVGAQIFGRALAAGAKQAIQNAKHRPQGALQSDAAGVGHATSQSMTDRLTREHRMTLDEAHLILNVKQGEPIDAILRNYEHLFKANSPPPPPEKPTTGRKATQTFYSHYLQSKVVRARERIEAELKIPEEAPPPPPPSERGSATPPPSSSSSTPPGGS